MNQILSTAIDKNKEKKKNDSKLTPEYKKKILIFFSIAIIIFGMIVGGIVIFNRIKKSNSDKDLLNKPEIEIITEGEKLKVTVSYDKGIRTITYIWNDSDIKEENYDDIEKTEKLLDIPRGEENKLYIKVMGADGKYSEKTEIQKVTVEPSDTEKPTIEWVQASSNSLKITVKDNNALDYVVYNWENEEETRLDAEEGQAQIEFNVEVLRRIAKLHVIAVDKDGNEISKVEKVAGVYKPTFSAFRTDDILKIEMEHDRGFDTVIINIGDNEYTYNKDSLIYDKDKTKLTFEFKVEKGKQTYVRIYIKSLEDTEENFEGYCDYY